MIARLGYLGRLLQLDPAADRHLVPVHAQQVRFRARAIDLDQLWQSMLFKLCPRLCARWQGWNLSRGDR